MRLRLFKDVVDSPDMEWVVYPPGSDVVPIDPAEPVISPAEALRILCGEAAEGYYAVSGLHRAMTAGPDSVE